MKYTIADMKKGDKGIIKYISIESFPIKLYEMGCLPGNKVSFIRSAPFRDPLYIIINNNHIAIRKQTAQEIHLDKTP